MNNIEKVRELNYLRNIIKIIRRFFKTEGVILKSRRRGAILKEFLDYHGIHYDNKISLRETVINIYLSKQFESLKQRDYLEDTAFYLSKEWRVLRKIVISVYGKCCMNCSKETPSPHVDHIKPRSLFPELQLDISNLQVLCQSCNLSKSNRNQNDYRVVILI